MNDDIPDQPRSGDRRKAPTGPWAAFRRGGRRVCNRRADEHRRPYFTDRFPPLTGVLILLLLVATVLDGVLTLHLLDAGAEEINPLMDLLLRKGAAAFLLGKYALTVAGLPFLLIFQNHYLFRTRIRVRHLLPTFVALYGLLLAYQAYLCLTCVPK